MKKVVIELINDDISGGSNAEIGLKLEDIIRQSFSWWHTQLGDSEPIRLDRWRVESIEVKEIYR
ncbi:MAG: hypothetical protein ACE5HC_09515 [Candidatus Binatia bacterium]